MPLVFVVRHVKWESARNWLLCVATALVLLTMLGSAFASNAHCAQSDDLHAFGGDWLYVEDRTPDRASEKQQPSMSVKFVLRVEEGAIVQVSGNGAKRREVRIALDGSTTEVVGTSINKRYQGTWKDGVLRYETELVNGADNSRVALIQREFRITPEGLLVRVDVNPPDGMKSVALYRHPQDITLPTPAKATIADMEWLSEAWIGKRGKASVEERWSPPLGGAILGVSRTVSGGSMVAFEFLRIVERDGGLVYVAQPGGASPTEFVLSEISASRAVFENPRHDFPQRIVYERSADGTMSASIGFVNGGRPQKFEFAPEHAEK